MRLIYIAGKLNGNAIEYIQNVHNMVHYGELVRHQGCAVALPCNDVIHGFIVGSHEYKDYFENNLEILKRCDAVAVVGGWEESEGTQKEIDCAIDLCIPVLYDFNEVMDYLERWR